MDTSTLHAFIKLAEIGHMTRAAAELHLTQPAVSAKLQRLEEDLGQRLFDRTSKGMVLTDAGELWLAHVTEALGALEAGQRALEALSGMQRGELAIGGGATATTYLLPPILGEFHARYPDIRLFVREQGSQSVLEAILSGELDLGVVTLPVELSAAKMSKLAIEAWIEDELQLLVPGDHELAQQRAFDWSELESEPLVLFEAGSAVRQILDARLEEANVNTQTVMELRSIESIKQMVRQGIGAAFVSRFALSAPERGLGCASGPVTRRLGIVRRNDRTPSPATEAFLDMMREHDALH